MAAYKRYSASTRDMWQVRVYLLRRLALPRSLLGQAKKPAKVPSLRKLRTVLGVLSKRIGGTVGPLERRVAALEEQQKTWREAGALLVDLEQLKKGNLEFPPLPLADPVMPEPPPWTLPLPLPKGWMEPSPSQIPDRSGNAEQSVHPDSLRDLLASEKKSEAGS